MAHRVSLCASLAGVAGAVSMNYNAIPVPSGDWSLALNIDSSDGHTVEYSNLGFWQSTTETGGATSDPMLSLTQDFKDPVVFSSVVATDVLIVVHNEGTALGWRTWELVNTDEPLSYYFTLANNCASTSSVITTASKNCGVMAVESTGGYVGTLSSEEPLVNNNGAVQALYSNAGTGSQDFNRLTTACAGDDNTGWGLGTTYDVQCIYGSCGTTYTCSGTSDRPQADAYLNHAGSHFSGGMIGTDNLCNAGASTPCQWSTTSGLEYDYAVYVGTRHVSTMNYSALGSTPPENSLHWSLALNIDTGDGHTVEYSNLDFWQSTAATGGAKSDPMFSLSRDFKDLDVFSSFVATDILIVVHTEGTALGWRTWQLSTRTSHYRIISRWETIALLPRLAYRRAHAALWQLRQPAVTLEASSAKSPWCITTGTCRHCT